MMVNSASKRPGCKGSESEEETDAAKRLVNRIQAIQEKSGKVLKEVELMRQKVRDIDSGGGGAAAGLRNMMVAASLPRGDGTDMAEIRRDMESAIRAEIESNFERKIRRIDEDRKEEAEKWKAEKEEAERKWREKLKKVEAEKEEVEKRWKEDVEKLKRRHEEELEMVKSGAKLTVDALKTGVVDSLRESASMELKKRNSLRREGKEEEGEKEGRGGKGDGEGREENGGGGREEEIGGGENEESDVKDEEEEEESKEKRKRSVHWEEKVNKVAFV